MKINDTQITKDLQNKIDLKTKPLGSLGQLEKLAFQIGKVQNTTSPQLRSPHLILFAGDHGITREGVSAYPSEVTYQMVINILNGGAAISVFCRQHGIQLITVDAGVNYDFDSSTAIIHAKVARGTNSFLSQKAMSKKELTQCFEEAEKVIQSVVASGSNCVGFGEMGIGNTSSSSMITHYLSEISLEDCIGRGTGLNEEQLLHKQQILEKARQFHGTITDPLEVLQTFGGLEIAQICGAMLSAYKNNLLVLVDGFIATSAFLVASKIEPTIINNAIFCHQGSEKGHKYLLQYLQAEPILQLSLRVGEGTGCALAYPIIESSVRFLNEMSSFESAGVSNK